MGKKLVAVAIIVGVALVVAGAVLTQRARVNETGGNQQETGTGASLDLGDIDNMLDEIEDYLTFENQDVLSGLEYPEWD
ncbi:MAG: hypothetical protein QXG10_04410 [Candidatus Hadarchaeales archaeon]